MTDLVVGLGEIGKPIKELLESRGFDVDGFDIKSNDKLQEKYDFVHICFPDNNDGRFIKQVQAYSNLGKIVIHSTVKPNTTKQLGCVYSPVRGVHTRMLEDLIYYTKYYSGNVDKEFEKRFVKTKNISDSTILENTKHYVDVLYYGYLIVYPRLIPVEVDWSFAEEIHEKLGNRPIMYDDKKKIGGHCIIQDSKLLDKEDYLAEIVNKGNIAKV